MDNLWTHQDFTSGYSQGNKLFQWSLQCTDLASDDVSCLPLFEKLQQFELENRKDKFSPPNSRVFSELQQPKASTEMQKVQPAWKKSNFEDGTGIFVVLKTLYMYYSMVNFLQYVTSLSHESPWL